MEQTRWLRGIDWITILLFLLIFTFGVLNIYSVDEAKGKKELVLFAVALGLIFGSLIINAIIKNFFQTYSWLFYFIGLLSLLGVLIFGKEINGAKAWYKIGSFTIQPAEFVKVATALFIGYILELKQRNLRQLSSVAICFIILGLPVGLILLQPDVGSVLVYFAFIIALYRQGLHWTFVIVPMLGIVVFLICVTMSPLYFLLIFGFIFLMILIITSFVLSKSDHRVVQFLRGFFLSLFVYFFLLFLILITNRLNGVLPYEIVQYKFLFGLNGTKTIIMFYILLGIISSSLFFFLFQGNKIEESAPFQVKESKFRYIIRSFLPSVLLLILIIGIGFSSKIIFDILPKHQKERILVLFEGEKKYRDSSGYNLLYSKTAIGSGELTGKGFREGTVKKGSFVPEQSTDYIFCTVGEEWGFVGSSIVVLLYTFLILRLFWLAETQDKIFSQFFGYSVASVILIHFIINIGMVTGLFPTVGIPLPFFSYGGSSLWAFSLFVSIFLILNYEGKQSLF